MIFIKKIILITGSDSGIGKYVAKRFLEKGNIVIITGYTQAHINETEKEFEEFKNITRYFQLDVTNENSIINMVDTIKKEYGHIDILINNAAFDQMNSIESYDANIFEKIIKTNLIGKMLCIKHCINLLKESKYPTIINISSRLATRPMKDSSAYCCAAAGIVMLTKCAALELSKYNIRVNTISPALTITPLSLKSYTKEQISEYADENPRNRLCETKDIYNLLNFLISEESDYINGENININGGILLK